MRKIPTIFKRDPENMSRLLDEPHPDCAWVFSGEGTATRKYDGTCCMVRDGKFYKRREVKKGKPAPSDFVLEQEDQNTGKRVGWVPVDPKSKEDRYHMEAWGDGGWSDGTYELLGPKIQGNPEREANHVLIAHSNASKADGAPTEFNALKKYLSKFDIEGFVWHHPDGRMAKIKLKDFGLKRN